MTAALPVYGKQYIRFAESARVPDALALAAFSLVSINNAPATEPPTLAQAGAAGGAIFGVIQQRFNLSTTGFATDLNRQGTVATSGLLLVRADGANMQAQNDALKSDANGRSSSAGGAVTVDGSTPIVRHAVQVGGENFVLVSFS
jgi:hypothetical protein